VKIALFHNHYVFRGGEDSAFAFQRDLLTAAGHSVHTHEADNRRIQGRARRLKIALQAPWSKPAYQEVLKFLRAHQPHLGHVHNWFPLFSPAIYDAHRACGIPVVQTLHNYRLGCARGTFLKAGRSCTDCLSGSRLQAIRDRCYQDSRAGALVWERTVARGWDKGSFAQVDAYVAPSDTVKDLHVAMGLPPERIHFIPHATADPLSDAGALSPPPGGGALFVGRLSREKGVDVLLEAWRDLDMPLRVVGTGPLESELKAANRNHRVEFLGQLSSEEVSAAIQRASFVVMPHRWLEPFGLVAIEALAHGRPVIASNLGGPADIIQDGVSGTLVPPEDARALQRAALDLCENPSRLARFSREARASYELSYHPRVHLRALTDLYGQLAGEPRPRTAAALSA
jgi:glycosyltransferase involved in cell wall biosynthesis